MRPCGRAVPPPPGHALVIDGAFDRHRVRVRPTSGTLRGRACRWDSGVRRCTSATSEPTRGRPRTQPRGRTVVRAGPLSALPDLRWALSWLALVVGCQPVPEIPHAPEDRSVLTAHHRYARRCHCSLSVLGSRPIMNNPVESAWPTTEARTRLLERALADPLGPESRQEIV